MQRLCEDVSMLVSALDVHQREETILDLIPNCMTVNLHMLGSLVENRISSYVHGRLIVTEEFGFGSDSDLQTREQLLKPKKFTCSVCHAAILCLCTTPANNILLLGFPCNQRITKVNAVTSDRTASIRTCNPVSV